MVTSEVFGSASIFLRTLNTLGLEYPPNPVTQHLSRVGVAALMERNFARLAQEASRETCEATLKQSPRWILIENEGGEVRTVLDSADLRAFLGDGKTTDEAAPDMIDLLRIPGMRKDCSNVDSRATLQEALLQLRSARAEALCVRRYSAPLIKPIIGVLTREQIDSYREVR